MLIDLKIKNGNLELKFDKYTTTYTVKVAEDITNLEFEYKLEDECNIRIRNNYLENDENIVYVDVYNVDKEETYTFYVYKEKSNLSNGIEDYKKSLEIIKNESIPIYKVQILSCSIFIIIIILFSIIFRKKV